MARIFVTSRGKRKHKSRLEKQVFASCVLHKKFSFGFLGLYRVLPVSGQCPVFLCLMPKYFMFFDAFQQIVLTLRPESMEL